MIPYGRAFSTSGISVVQGATARCQCGTMFDADVNKTAVLNQLGVVISEASGCALLRGAFRCVIIRLGGAFCIYCAL